MTVLTDRRVAPFGHLGITACVPLPRASRSLPRPSSPPCAQASPTCLHSLDYNSSSHPVSQAERLPPSQSASGLSADPNRTFSAARNTPRPSPFFTECQSLHPSLDEMLPFNK